MNARRFGLFAIILFQAISGAFGQPANDNFADRTVVTGSSVTFPGSVVGATFEAAELNTTQSFIAQDGASVSGGSVWWTWTAPRSCTVVIQPARDYSIRDAAVAVEVYEGTSLSSLIRKCGASFSLPAGRYAEFRATAGVSYQIQVAGSWSPGFSLKLTASDLPVFVIQPENVVASPFGSVLFSAYANLHDSDSNPPYHGGFKGYQWNFNGVPIPGEVFPTLLIQGVTTNHAGRYLLTASNAAGITESTAASLVVTDTNPVPRLAALTLNNPGQLPCMLTGEVGRWYQIESSQDLQSWGSSVWVKATNSPCLLAIARLGPKQFVRGSLNVPTDICVGQLKRMRAALAIYAIDMHLPVTSSYLFFDIKKYLPVNEYGGIDVCPEGGTYFSGNSMTNGPYCSLSSRGHSTPDL